MSHTLAEVGGRLVLGLHALGWALAYATVAGALAGALTWAATALLDRRRAWVRYVVSGGALLLAVGSIGLGWSSVWSGYGGHDGRVAEIARELAAKGSPDGEGPLPGGWDAAGLDRAVATLHDHEIPPWIDGEGARRLGTVLAVLAAVWLVGVAERLVRLAAALRDVAGMDRRSTDTAAPRWKRLLAEARRDLGVRRPVRLRVSTEVDGPVLIGWRSPAILLPRAAHDALTDAEARAVLLHELAHVRRGDYAMNLVQMAAEALLFFHPVTPWLGERLRDEREYCSDEVAHRSLGGPLTAYLRALEALERFRAGGRTPEPAVSAGRSLLSRIERLAGVEPRLRGRVDVDVLLVVATLVALWLPVAGLGRHAHHASVALMKHELTLPRDYERILGEEAAHTPMERLHSGG